MKNNSLKEMVLAGLFIAMGLMLPTIFHAVGMGSTFLPMHIPVLLAGFVLSFPYAVAVGVLTPVLSSIFTGMPPMFPVMPYMVFELAAYAFAASLLYRKFKLNVYISLILSMIVGRIVSMMAVWSLATFFLAKLPGPIVFITGAVAKSIPGIIIQIIFIPAIIMALSRYRLISREVVGHGS